TRAVDGVNFTVNEGEFLSLVGTNGAGKTTLVNLISAFLAPASGRIFIGDRDITHASVEERSRAGIARSFQLVNLFDDLSVLDNVALAIFAREGKTKRILALAERDTAVTREASDLLGEFGLDGKSEGRAGGLAQGERKLLDVAVAYALRPRLLFLDEPTSGVSTRDKAHILHGVSLSVRSHEVVCLVGRNGAGKTTTMESIMGFVPVKSGQILFHGEEVTSLPVHSRARRGMGYAPEGSEIFPELTVAENM